MKLSAPLSQMARPFPNSARAVKVDMFAPYRRGRSWRKRVGRILALLLITSVVPFVLWLLFWLLANVLAYMSWH
jgi:hypothetical protein